ncbi:MAG TPA: glycosyltransferase family 9 protein [Usitatibacter sp.]|nr:glycosyltransferase family 9 protein [Usitatibacter sp.]
MENWAGARKLLCVRLDGVGGVIATTPAFRALRQSTPNRRLTLLASRTGARAAACIPEIDEAIGYEAPWLAGLPPAASADSAMRYALGMRGFDAAIVFSRRGDDASGAVSLCRLAGIPLVHAAEGRQGEGHDVACQLALVAAIGATAEDDKLSFRPPPHASWRARMKLEEAGVEVHRPFIVLHPGATRARDWAVSRLGEAARELSQILDAQVVVTGNAAEREVAEESRRAAGDRARCVAGSLALDELAALLEMSAMVLTRDAMPALLASALGTAVVNVHAEGAPRHAPWRVAHRLVPASAALEVEEVVTQACELWLDIHWRAAA